MNAFPDITKTMAADSASKKSVAPKRAKKSGTDAFEKHLDKPDFQDRENKVDPLDGSTNTVGSPPFEPVQPVDRQVSADENNDASLSLDTDPNSLFALLGDFSSTQPALSGQEIVSDQSNPNAAIVGIKTDELSGNASAQTLTTTNESIVISGESGPVGSLDESPTDGTGETKIPSELLGGDETTTEEGETRAALIEATSTDGNSDGNATQTSALQQSADTSSKQSANNAAVAANEREIAKAEAQADSSTTSTTTDSTDETPDLPSDSQNSNGNQSQSHNLGAESSIVSQITSEPLTSNFQQPQTFTAAVAQAAQQTTEVEAPASLQPLSEPTSQLKVAILANAASIENDSTHSIQVDLHPAELGRLQIRIDQTGDQLTAKIVATEIASSELLMQDRQHLVEALNELGFGEASLDISHGDTRNPNNDEEIPKDARSFDAMSEEPAPKAAPAFTPIKSTGVNFVA